MSNPFFRITGFSLIGFFAITFIYNLVEKVSFSGLWIIIWAVALLTIFIILGKGGGGE